MRSKIITVWILACQLNQNKAYPYRSDFGTRMDHVKVNVQTYNAVKRRRF